MSQGGTNIQGSGGTPVGTLTGNSGGAVSPSGGGNINVVGSGIITVTGNPGTNTLTISSGTTTLNYTNVATTPYVVLITDYYISVDASGGARTIQLPNAATLGQSFIIKDRTGSAATNNITITTVGGAVLIDGSTSVVINSAYESLNIIGNGTGYELF